LLVMRSLPDFRSVILQFILVKQLHPDKKKDVLFFQLSSTRIASSIL